MTGRIVQISVSNGGVPKTAVPAARITEEGVEGDWQRDREHHGGPDRAVCLFSMERIRELQREGHAIVPGAVGENVTVEGIDWDTIEPNSRLLLGDTVELEVTRYTSPCVNIKSAFADGNYARISQKRHAGWSRVYARVLAPGTVRAGDPVRVLPPGVGEAGQVATRGTGETGQMAARSAESGRGASARAGEAGRSRARSGS